MLKMTDTMTSQNINFSSWDILYTIMSQDISVGITTGYELDGRDSFPDKRKVFLFSIASRLVLGPTQPLI
jgi:hypothetical protein